MSRSPAMSPRSDLWLVLALAVATGLLTAAPFAWSRTLYNDTLAIYSFFSDNLDSLARFGEPAYWLAYAVVAGAAIYAWRCRRDAAQPTRPTRSSSQQ